MPVQWLEQCKRHSNLLLILQPIIRQLWNFNCQGWKIVECQNFFSCLFERNKIFIFVPKSWTWLTLSMKGCRMKIEIASSYLWIASCQIVYCFPVQLTKWCMYLHDVILGISNGRKSHRPLSNIIVRHGLWDSFARMQFSLCGIFLPLISSMYTVAVSSL